MGIDSSQVFVILGQFAAIRPALLRRAWVERRIVNSKMTLATKMDSSSGQSSSAAVASMGEIGPTQGPSSPPRGGSSCLDGVSTLGMSRPLSADIEDMDSLLANPPDLIWASRRTDLDVRTLQPTQIVNYFRKDTAIITQVCRAQSQAYPYISIILFPSFSPHPTPRGGFFLLVLFIVIVVVVVVVVVMVIILIIIIYSHCILLDTYIYIANTSTLYIHIYMYDYHLHSWAYHAVCVAHQQISQSTLGGFIHAATS